MWEYFISKFEKVTNLYEEIGTDDDLKCVIKDEKGIDVVGFSVFHEVRPPKFDNVDV